MLESQIQADILNAFVGDRRLRLWRNNTGVAERADGGRIRFGVPGQADLSGILVDGRRLEIEVKQPGRYQTQQQRAFEAMIRQYGGVYILARSVDDAVAGVHAALA